MDLSPIRFSLDLACSPEHAFAVFTGRIGEWWSPRYTSNPETLDTVVIEPVAGGRVFERHRDGDEFDWGHVVACVPGQSLVYSSTLAQDPAHPSEIAVTFSPRGTGSRFDFEHRGWDEANEGFRSKFRDWPALLGRFAELTQAP